ncbi:MAG: response regulator, partial [Alphaproteobacteria bacterium]|nr:response regulator [Alphaproteobacteria bacterium]
MKILLVEDNEGDVEMASRAFRKSPTTLTVAHNGVEAMDYLRQQNTDNIAVLPDIILLDLNMPCMGGKEFLETIKLDPGLRFIPVIMFTSSDAPADIRECYELHASSYIIKPFDIQQYTSTLNQIE